MKSDIINLIARTSELLDMHFVTFHIWYKYTMQPFFNWVGSKRRYVKRLAAYCPQTFNPTHNTYYEPFLGSGSMLFHLQPAKAVVGDVDPVLIQAFKTMKSNSAAVKELLLKIYRADPQAVYKTLCKEFGNLSPVEQTAALIYILKHSYGSLLRFSADRHKIISNYRKQPIGMNWLSYDRAAKYFQANRVHIMCTDFTTTVQHAKAGDFVFLDPPYFIANRINLYFENTLALEALCNTMNSLHKKGCLVLLIHNIDNTLDQNLIGYKRYPFVATESFVTAKSRQESVYINYRL